MAFCRNIRSHEKKTPIPKMKNPEYRGLKSRDLKIFENLGDKNPEMKKNPESRGLKSRDLKNLSNPDPDLRDFGIFGIF